MATITAWIGSHLALVVAGVAAAVIAWFKRDDIRAKLPAWMPGSLKENPDTPKADDDGFGFGDVLSSITNFVNIIKSQADGVKRAIHLSMLVAIEDDIAALPDSPERTEQLAAIQTLAKYRVVSQTKTA